MQKHVQRTKPELHSFGCNKAEMLLNQQICLGMKAGSRTFGSFRAS
jgi:hypothetical protein